MSSTKLELFNADEGTCVRVTPPQTNDIPDFVVGKGAYLFVIDVSGSMNAAAQVTTDDGDKVNHGWSQLDIAKHSTNTFVSSLGDEDYISVVTYSDGANVLLDWTKTTEEGRERAIAAIHSMRPERSTNLMAGITTGFSQFEAFPGKLEGGVTVSSYALSLIITTDGMPSSQWHPARGRDGYAPLVKTLAKGLRNKCGPEAVPVVTSIGIGFQLDSELLYKFSETFLHMPDPGQIGPFIVNLLAAVRSTARLPTTTGNAANACSIVLPADALATDTPNPVPGFTTETIIDENGVENVVVPLGSVLYDQPRHVLIRTKPNANYQLGLRLGETVALAVRSDQALEVTDQLKRVATVQSMRLKAVQALDAAVACANPGDCAAPIIACIAELRASSVAGVPAVAKLADTMEKECILGAEAANFRRWGGHYFRTLPCMLRAERRSNFRDECLQHFGQDARAREALFESQSNMAEMRFATLAPPEPSLLRPVTPVYSSVGVAGTTQPATAAPRPPVPTALPDEFMRGGGCFGADSLVTVARADGGFASVKVSDVRAGDLLVGEGGRIAPVRCVVATECAGGRVMLTRLPNGAELTEWHPVRAANGRWHFPNLLGERVVRSMSHVYNFVLPPGHATVVVGGVPCAALGHGLSDPVVAHPYWGTEAVILDLMAKEGWREGRVLIHATPTSA